MSLGLIVTELVINALKHAFPTFAAARSSSATSPTGRTGRLSVSDNGVGMPEEPSLAKPGLGTSIVEALAKQLKARVQVADANPGTKVSIAHHQIAAVETDIEPDARAVWTTNQAFAHHSEARRRGLHLYASIITFNA